MPLLILLLVSLVATYLVYRDAAGRGMRARAWALFILLTSGIGLPIYLLARRGRAAP